jgi:hypothetical protein
LVVPVLFGEVLFVVLGGRITRPVTRVQADVSARAQLAEALAQLQLVGHGFDLCLTGAALHLSIAIAGVSTFETSWALHACSGDPTSGLAFLWGAVALILVVCGAFAARELHVQQQDLIVGASTKLAGLSEEDAADEMGQLVSVYRRTRWTRTKLILLGWAIIYLAAIIALVPLERVQ